MVTIAEALVEVRADTTRIGSDVESGVAKESGRFKKAGAGIGKGLALGIGAAAGGAVIAGGFLKGAITGASDLAETVNKSNAIFGRNAAQIDAWARTAATSVGLSREEALATTAAFGDMFTQIGFTGKQAAGMSKDTVQLAADLGSFNNLETGDVLDRISGALRGEYDSLQAVIPNINAARVEQEALAKTGKAAASELTAQEKAAAVLAIVQKDGARAAGDFAKTSDGLANQQKILGAQFDDLKAKAGAGLLPVVTKVFGFLNDTALPAVSNLGPAFDRLKTFLAPTIDAVRGVFTAFGGGEAAAGRLAGIKTIVADVFGSVKRIVSDVVVIVKVLWRAFGDDVLRFTRTAFSAVGGVIRGAFRVISGLFKIVKSLLTGDWRGLWQGIKATVSGAWGVIKNVVKLGWAALRGMFSVLGTALKGLMSRAWDGIKAAVGRGIDGVVGFVKALPGRIASAARGAWDGLTNSFRDAINGIIGKWNDLSFSVPGFNPPGPGSVPGFTISTPNIPMLANGGTATRTGTALVGERGPELLTLQRGASVVPLDRVPTGGGGTVGLLTITNWRDGTGYFRTVAAGEVDAADAYAGTLARMGR